MKKHCIQLGKVHAYCMLLENLISDETSWPMKTYQCCMRVWKMHTCFRIPTNWILHRIHTSWEKYKHRMPFEEIKFIAGFRCSVCSIMRSAISVQYLMYRIHHRKADGSSRASLYRTHLHRTKDTGTTHINELHIMCHVWIAGDRHRMDARVQQLRKDCAVRAHVTASQVLEYLNVALQHQRPVYLHASTALRDDFPVSML